jgi:hypothetical protein
MSLIYVLHNFLSSKVQLVFYVWAFVSRWYALLIFSLVPNILNEVPQN